MYNDSIAFASLSSIAFLTWQECKKLTYLLLPDYTTEEASLKGIVQKHIVFQALTHSCGDMCKVSKTTDALPI